MIRKFRSDLLRSMDSEQAEVKLDPIQYPGMARLWSVVYVDLIDRPQFRTKFMVRGNNANHAISNVARIESFQEFKKMYPQCEAVEVSFLGRLET